MSIDSEGRELQHDLKNLVATITSATNSMLERSDLHPRTRADLLEIQNAIACGVWHFQPDEQSGSSVRLGLISFRDMTRRASRHGAIASITWDLQSQVVFEDCGRLRRRLAPKLLNVRTSIGPSGKARLVRVKTDRRSLTFAKPNAVREITAGDYVVVKTRVTRGEAVIARSRQIRVDLRRKLFRSAHGLRIPDLVRRAKGIFLIDRIGARGMEYLLYFPVNLNPVRSPHCTRTPRELAGRVILLVDDDMPVRRFTERILSRAGWVVLMAESAETALMILKRSICDLMISDVAMPEIDGLTLTRQALAMQPNLPIILSSGYTCDIESESLPGNVLFLAKPYDKADLMAAIARIDRN